MTMRIRNELYLGKVFAGIVILAIMVSIGMALLQRYPTLTEGLLVVISGAFISVAMSN